MSINSITLWKSWREKRTDKRQAFKTNLSHESEKDIQRCSCKPFPSLKCFSIYCTISLLRAKAGDKKQPIGAAEERNDSDWIILTGRHLMGFEYLVRRRNGENDSIITGVNQETWSLKVITDEKLIKGMCHPSGISRWILSKVGSVWDEEKFLIPILTVIEIVWRFWFRKLSRVHKKI